jgi:organic hydroperoxide reductase OsmC/OhrA
VNSVYRPNFDGRIVILQHHLTVAVEWLGNRGTGTSDYKSYGRELVVSATGKPSIVGSSDRAFRGDAERWNPEELLVASLSQCHMLSYLHLAATHGIVVTEYTDSATGTFEQTGDGEGHFTLVTLRPLVTISSGDPATAIALHHDANDKCFIASSVNFPVRTRPELRQT